MIAQQLLSKITTIGIFFVILFIYTKIAGPIPFAINSITTTKSTTFDVTGQGKVTIKPDSTTISAGVSATGATTSVVQNQINSLINAVTTAVKNVGIDSKDIQTANYNINPTYNYSEGTQKITGYTANTTLTIKVNDLTKANAVIDAVTAAGATNVNSRGFSNSDSTNAENQARQLAIADAKKKAQDIANIAGFHLGKIINYSENSGGSPRQFDVSSLKVGGGTGTNIEPGTNEVTINITLSYQIE